MAFKININISTDNVIKNLKGGGGGLSLFKVLDRHSRGVGDMKYLAYFVLPLEANARNFKVIYNFKVACNLQDEKRKKNEVKKKVIVRLVFFIYLLLLYF